MTQGDAVRFFVTIIVVAVVLAGVLFGYSLIAGDDDPELEAVQPPWQDPEIPQVPQNQWSQEDPWGKWR